MCLQRAGGAEGCAVQEGAGSCSASVCIPASEGWAGFPYGEGTGKSRAMVSSCSLLKQPTAVMRAGLLVSCFILAVWYHCREVPKFPFDLVVVPYRQEATGSWALCYVCSHREHWEMPSVWQL